jgi:hypothetical protein
MMLMCGHDFNFGFRENGMGVVDLNKVMCFARSRNAAKRNNVRGISPKASFGHIAILYAVQDFSLLRRCHPKNLCCCVFRSSKISGDIVNFVLGFDSACALFFGRNVMFDVA